MQGVNATTHKNKLTLAYEYRRYADQCLTDRGFILGAKVQFKVNFMSNIITIFYYVQSLTVLENEFSCGLSINSIEMGFESCNPL